MKGSVGSVEEHRCSEFCYLEIDEQAPILRLFARSLIGSTVNEELKA